MIGTLINVLTIIIGSVIGIIIHKRLPKKIISIVFQSLGLFVIIIGILSAVKAINYLIVLLSLVVGSILGELLDIEGFIDRLLKKSPIKNKNFSKGLLSAFLLFCLGSMTILGAFEEGLQGKPDIIITKAIMDGFSSAALSATFGIGVIFSVIPLLIYQGGLTLLAGYFHEFFSNSLIAQLSAVGGILLIALGINVLEIKKIKVINMLPSLIVVVVLSLVFI